MGVRDERRSERAKSGKCHDAAPIGLVAPPPGSSCVRPGHPQRSHQKLSASRSAAKALSSTRK